MFMHIYSFALKKYIFLCIKRIKKIYIFDNKKTVNDNSYNPFTVFSSNINITFPDLNFLIEEHIQMNIISLKLFLCTTNKISLLNC